jgi:lipopolysaccharide transport system permease protein
MNPHAATTVSPLEMILGAIRHKGLIFQMARREIQARYRGSILGMVWSLFTPLVMLSVYTFFFSVVFKARWGVEQSENHTEYALILFVGLIVHGLFSECFNRAPALIIGNVNFVKKIVFPLEILPWITLGNAIFHASISLGVLLMAQWIIHGFIPWTAVYLPMVIFPFLILLLGCMWFLAAMGVYLRDISQTTGIISTVLLFVSPVFYSLSILPATIQRMAMLNPLSLIITQMRGILLFNESPNFIALSLYSVLSMMFAWGGFFVFQKTRKGFADVI